MLTSALEHSMARLERLLPATSMARHSRVHSSTIVMHLSCFQVGAGIEPE